MAKRTITLTGPEGQPISVNVGPSRQVGAIRITHLSDCWAPSVHRTLANAVTGPNQTPMWNGCTRWAIAIDVNDQPAGDWLPATK